jgi:hypothetical protein
MIVVVGTNYYGSEDHRATGLRRKTSGITKMRRPCTGWRVAISSSRARMDGIHKLLAIYSR